MAEICSRERLCWISKTISVSSRILKPDTADTSWMSVTWQCGHPSINEATFPKPKAPKNWIAWLEQHEIYLINMLISNNQSGHTNENSQLLPFPTLSPFLGRHTYTLTDGHVSVYLVSWCFLFDFPSTVPCDHIHVCCPYRSPCHWYAYLCW